MQRSQQEKYLESASRWEDIYADFLPLYLSKTTDEIVSTLKQRHDFWTTRDMCERQIARWKHAKRLPTRSYKALERRFVAEVANRRKEEEGRKTSFHYHGKWEIGKQEQDKFVQQQNRQPKTVMPLSLDSLPPDWPISFSDPKLPTPSLSLSEPKEASIKYYMDYLFYEKEQPSRTSDEFLAKFCTLFEERQASPDPPSSTGTLDSHGALVDGFEGIGSRSSSPDIPIAEACESPIGLWNDFNRLEIEPRAFSEGAPYMLAYFLEQALQYDKSSAAMRSSLSSIVEMCPSHLKGFFREIRTNDAHPGRVEVDAVINQVYHAQQQFEVATQQLIKKPLELFQQNAFPIELQIVIP